MSKLSHVAAPSILVARLKRICHVPEVARSLLLLLTIAIAGSATLVHAQHLDPGEYGAPEIYIPHRLELFRQEASDSTIRPAIFVADLPSIHVPVHSAQPLGREPVLTGTKVTTPVSLASYQEVVDGEASEIPVPVGVSEEDASVINLGWGFKLSADNVDRLRLKHLEQQSIADLEKAMESAETVTDETRQQLDRIKNWHSRGVNSLSQISKLKSEIKGIPEDLRQLQQVMSQPLPAPPSRLDDSLTLEAHEVLLTDHERHEEKLRNEYNAVESRLSNRNKKLTTLASQELQANERLAAAAPVGGNQVNGDLAQRARIIEDQAIVIASKIDLRLISMERQWLEANGKNTFLRKDWLKRQLDHASDSTRRLSNLVAQRREELIKAEAELARREASDVHPVLRELAEQNATLAEQQSRITVTVRELTIEQQELDQRIAAIETSREKLDEHLQAAGHSRAVGMMLRFERNELPQTRPSQQRIYEIEGSLPDLHLKRLEIKEQLDQLVNQQSRIEHSISHVQSGPADESEADLSAKATELFNKKRVYLFELHSRYEKYLNGLARLQQSHTRLIDDTHSLRLYIDQHVLWIRSAEPIDSSDFARSIQAIKAIGATEQWQSMIDVVRTKTSAHWPLLILIVAGLWPGLGMRRLLDRRLRNACRRRSEYRIAPLIRSLLLTLFQASFLAILVATPGWLLAAPYEVGSMKDSISRGLLLIAPQLFIASVIHRMAIPGGLGGTQLGWSTEVCELIRQATATIARFCLPLVAITCFLEYYEGGRWIDSLGRLVFIASMIVLAMASLRLLHGIGRAWKTDAHSSRSIWEQTFALWSPLVVFGPIALASVAALGYMYSSVFLGVRLLMTWWLILGTVSAFFVASRLIDIGHNIIVARRGWRTPSGNEPAGPSNDNPAIEIESNAIRLQVTRLLHVTAVAFCLFMAFSFWSEAVPAVKVFDYGLWQVSRTVETPGPDQATTITTTRLTWVTVGDILGFLLVLAATIILSRNLPGLLQMVILDRLPLDRGGKYAISIVCRYLVAAIGFVFACRTIGLTWNSVQWLVAAMSVGLGFGLQEIFANFVAGIIILLERPVRVGDFVTVNGTTGFVTRIQLRATMIIDYDRRELIVPNKKFITDDVINWTLTDPITRVVVPIGIAYGSDTRQAQNALMTVAREDPLVLKEPKPDVVFAKFGGSSLDFELRVHIANRDNYPEIVHQLHMSIDEEFRRQGIEIAFPQQDINLKGIETLLGSFADGKSRKRAG